MSRRDEDSPSGTLLTVCLVIVVAIVIAQCRAANNCQRTGGIAVKDWAGDGGLRANARAQGPRIIVSATTRHGPMRWPCDTFKTFEANLYAIALTLETLRAIDRYGVSARGEQYRGWNALPAETSVTDNVDAAWTLLQREGGGGAGVHARTRDQLDRLYRAAAMRAHPDAGGTNERMSAVNRARDTIVTVL